MNTLHTILPRLAAMFLFAVIFAAAPRLAAQTSDTLTLIVWYDAKTSIAPVKERLGKLNARVVDSALYFHRVTIEIASANVAALKQEWWFRSLSPPLRPQPHVVDISRSAIGADLVLPLPYGAMTPGAPTGLGVLVGVFDAGTPYPNFCFGGRLNFRSAPLGCPFESQLHFTHVAGIIGGAGQTAGQINAWAGIAPEATLYAYNIFSANGDPHFCSVSSDLPEDKLRRALDTNINVIIVNNSWGLRPSSTAPCDDFGTYDGTCRDYDQIVRDANISVFCSAGNFRAACSDYPCSPQTAAGYGLIMSPAVAKNVVTVGSVDQNGSTSAYYSSWGPTRDGRIKPDFVAVGSGVVSSTPNNKFDSLSGTSMACPMGSGAAALLVQKYRLIRELPFPFVPNPALIKALLLNTATDVANPGPDFKTGFGRLDVRRALRALSDKRYQVGTLYNQGYDFTDSFHLTSACTLKVMMVYSDMQGAPYSNRNLVNDLDLTLEGYDAGGNAMTYHPLVLDPTHPAAIAVPGVDSLNNVEQVVVLNPGTGTWKIHVHATHLDPGGAPQSFALTWDGSNDPVADLYMRDQDIPLDLGSEPNYFSQPLWQSNDIWVRNADDGEIHQHEHQSPIDGQANYVYVKVRNRGCGDAAGTLHLYWSKSSTAARWPEHWNGDARCNTEPWGGEIGPAQTVAVPGLGEQIVRFTWTPPDSTRYRGCGAEGTQFALLARIETAPTYPYGMTFAESPDLQSNVLGNNNIVWKNVTLLQLGSAGGSGSILVHGYESVPRTTGFFVTMPPNSSERSLDGPGRTLLDVATVELGLRDDIHARWIARGTRGRATQADRIGGTGIQLTAPYASIEGIPIAAGDDFPISITIRPRAGLFRPTGQYQLSIAQAYVPDSGSGNVFIGGGTFLVTFADSGKTHIVVDPAEDVAAGGVAVTPNPAIRSAVVDFTVTTPAHIRIELRDAAGRAVRMVAEAEFEPGVHAIEVPLDGVPSGTYFWTLSTPHATIARPLIVVH